MVEGGTAHGWERSTDQLVCLEVPPAPVYKGSRGRGRPARRRARQGGVLLPPGVGLPLFLVGVGGGKEGREGKKERGASPRPQLGLGLGARPTSWPPPLSSTKAHVGPLSPRGVPVTPRYSEKCPNSSETFPVSKHNLPIYQSSCIFNFKTPRHVHDHIRDSEQPSVHKNT